ncbi:hypothetical protein D1614_22825 [Maribellus luteus]|uniref:Uncharacterized protein n=1 Tax=Maribellus luteus TaxID=2305463 RepID=A0A399SU75_9BACT|nr:hypothetical protein [Maribellus luteus]RIJ45505.1 hypothetical protein D1614_22825 [Maribellus luteus]
MKIIKHLIFIYVIALLFFGCASSTENATSVFDSGNNYILLGFWHGIIIPFSLMGKAIGLNIGIYDAGKDVLSYWLGYIFALLIYAKIIRVLWLGIRLKMRKT